MPTVLYVHHTAILGGAEQSLVELLTGLDRTVWAPVAVLPGAGPLRDALASHGIPVEHAPLGRVYKTLNPRRLGAYAAQSLRVSRALARIVVVHRPDLVHANSTIAHLWAARMARRSGLATVWHVRDLQRRPRVERPLALLTDAIVSISRAVDGTIASLVRPGMIRRVVHNGLDAARFAAAAEPGAFRRTLGISPEVPLLVCACQLVPWKGVDVLLDAFALVRQTHPTAHLAVVGEDAFGVNRDYVARLNRQAANLRGCVTLTGYRADMATVFGDAAVVVVPSLAEPFGRVVLEAMALSRPVVGTAAGGLPEVVVDGRTGLLVPPGDAGALAGAIERLLADRGLRAQLGAAGLRRVRERFSSAAHAAQIQDLYSTLLRRAMGARTSGIRSGGETP